MSDKYEPTVVRHAVVGRPPIAADGTSALWPSWMIDALREWCAMAARPSLAMMASMLNSDKRFNMPDRKTRNAVLGKIHRLGLGERIAYLSPSKADGPQTNVAWTAEADQIIINMGSAASSGVIAKAIIRETGLQVNDQHVRYRRNVLGVPLVKPKTNAVVRRSPFQSELARCKSDFKVIPKDEPLPSTCVDVQDADKSTCMYPLNSDVRDLKVCGSKASVGAYCDHHAKLAYTMMPTAKRNRAYHRRNEFDR